MYKKDIDIRYVELENTLALLQKCPGNNKVINDFYSQAKPIFLSYIGSEELFHDFILKVIENIDKIDFTKSVKNWLITLSRNIEINEIIKKNRKKRTFLEFNSSLVKFEDYMITNNEYIDGLDQTDFQFDKKFYIIYNTLTPDEQQFFNDYYHSNDKKVMKDRIKMHNIKKAIKEKFKKDDY